MEKAYSILMLCFALALLLYAAAIALSRSTSLIPRSTQVKMRNPRRYAWQFSKTLACVALGPAVSALAGLCFGAGIGVAVLFPAMAAAIWFGIRFMKDVD